MEQATLQWFWDGLDAFLLRQQLKQTKQRKIIVTHFLSADKHMDAEELHQITREDGHNIGLATIYRTLSLLKEAGLVIQHTFADGRATYEVSHPGAHHDHLICVTCAKIVEFESEEIEDLQKIVAEKQGFRLTSHRLDLYGICRACA